MQRFQKIENVKLDLKKTISTFPFSSANGIVFQQIKLLIAFVSTKTFY